jgi:hypothetical protein
MAAELFSLPWAERQRDRVLAALPFTEATGADGSTPLLALRHITDGGDAGFVRRWHGDGSHLGDRVVHFRLASGAVDTELLFFFGRPDAALPHLHLQVVQFGADACVFNADWLPRLDPVDYPDYFRTVLEPMNKPYWQAVNDRKRACSHAPGNPAVSAYLSPWSIGAGRPTTQAELAAVTPSIDAYVEHWLALARSLDFAGPDAASLRRRDARHLACFLDERLDPRAWRGVYSAIGEDAGHAVRRIIQQGHFQG